MQDFSPILLQFFDISNVLHDHNCAHVWQVLCGREIG